LQNHNAVITASFISTLLKEKRRKKIIKIIKQIIEELLMWSTTRLMRTPVCSKKKATVNKP
jgi:hypothetical protein